MKLDKNSVYLKPITIKHISQGWLNWVKNKKNYRTLNTDTKNFNKQRLIKYINNLKTNKSIMYAVYDSNKKKYFGNLKLNNMDYEHKTCSYGRMIGEDDYKNKGYGRIMLYKICELAFKKYKFNKIYTYVYTDNNNSILSNKKFGMKIEGKLKSHFIKNKKKKDVFLYSMLKEEFLKKKFK